MASSAEATTAAEVLAKARDIYVTRGWHKEGGGDHCLVMAVGAAETELTGAPRRTVAGDQALQYLCRVTEASVPHVWHDAPSTTYEDVVLCLKRAEELALDACLAVSS